MENCDSDTALLATKVLQPEPEVLGLYDMLQSQTHLSLCRFLDRQVGVAGGPALERSQYCAPCLCFVMPLCRQ